MILRNSTFLVLLIILINSCTSNEKIRILVSNPLDQQRNDAIILLTRSAIENWQEIPEDQVPLLTDEADNPIPSQLDDLNNDGEWDELFALTDMESLGQKTIVLTFISPDEYPSFEVRKNLRLGGNEPGYPELLKAERLEGITYHNHGRTGEVYQMEGPAWENDMVGFRNYLDQRNGMDIFGKLTNEMVLDSVGIEGRQSYHEPDDWGMDVLKVGTSLGAGAIGYMFNDSIYRAGDNGSGTYEVLFEGSQRSRFNLTFTNWEVEDTPVDVIHQIEIVAGRHCFQSSVTYSGSDITMNLVPGIVNMKSDSLFFLKLNDYYSGLLTHDYQSEDSSLLAMALIIPTGYLKSPCNQ